ncbi:MAG: class 1 fructose-bisphosphatase [bacterium]|nr:class 1 fructose-bisphosphatase [bacterium]
MQTKLMTISRFIYEEQRKYPNATGEFSDLLEDIAIAAKVISHQVNKAGLLGILGIYGNHNVHGEVQQKLDVFAHHTFIKMLEHGGHLAVMASEESEEVIHLADDANLGNYVINFDPLDGSSNIDANVSVGTIFSIHRKRSKGSRGTIEDCLQAGKYQVASGYIIYGSSTMMVYTTGNGVHGFTLDPSVGEFLLSHPYIQIPKKGKYYSCNEAYYPYWDKSTQSFINYLKENDVTTNRPYSLRYIGSMVADIHRTLLYGGIFLYPADTLDPKKPDGKLRLLYEVSPISFLIQQAGGLAVDGKGNDPLEIVPTSLHQRTPIIAGSKEDVEVYLNFLRDAN